jgi:Cytochrome oxidase c subunit VIb
MASALDKEGRQSCWQARDLYFSCMDKNSYSNQPSPACEKLRELFEAACPAVWVSVLLFSLYPFLIYCLYQVDYFVKKRHLAIDKAQRLAKLEAQFGKAR